MTKRECLTILDSLFMKKMIRYYLSPERPNRKKIKKVVEILNNGGIIAFPTDTTYAIGCKFFNHKGVDALNEFKKRRSKNPLTLICKDLKDISRYALVSDFAYKIMRKLVPGRYTFILTAKRLVPRVLRKKRKTVGIRVPDNLICQMLIEELDSPLVSMSAKSPLTKEILELPEEIIAHFSRELDAIIDVGIIVPNLSTVIDLTEDEIKVIREGAGSLEFV